MLHGVSLSDSPPQAVAGFFPEERLRAHGEVVREHAPGRVPHAVDLGGVS